ncbi:hypothetical protein PVE_P0060 (plasmid) [Pseudomonas veronii 1YdBTEX2]|uniref:Uncharacterized protein n=1 Tax=Pseudomonas veronii 1YdBTEX2 TaxID=1295141 RepID=A0A1D3KA38_PSEVE|nr:hypothetical protein PVE_P0060 [Pseudomonas veronii 1YdBTEX2]
MLLAVFLDDRFFVCFLSFIIGSFPHFFHESVFLTGCLLRLLDWLASDCVNPVRPFFAVYDGDRVIMTACLSLVCQPCFFTPNGH